MWVHGKCYGSDMSILLVFLESITGRSRQVDLSKSLSIPESLCTMLSMCYMAVLKLSLFTEVVDHSPVLVGHCEPLAVSRTNVDVHRAEVVVLLVAWRGRMEGGEGEDGGR